MIISESLVKERPVTSLAPEQFSMRNIALLVTAILMLAQAWSQGFLPVAHSETQFSFAAAGDLGSTAYTNDSLRILASSKTSFFLALGDLDYQPSNCGPTYPLSSSCQEYKWCGVVHSYVGESYPFELVTGNHENLGANGWIDNFAQCLPDHLGPSRAAAVVGSGLCGNRTSTGFFAPQGCYGTEYYIDYPEQTPVARIIMISARLSVDEVPYYYSVGNPHYNWVSDSIDSARAEGIPWVIVAFHKPCLSIGVKGCESGPDLMNLLISKRVDLVLNGHDHSYQRSKQLTCADGPAYSTSPTATDAGYQPSCVANNGSTGSYPKGTGTVFVIQGTFGKSLDSINATDPEAPYFVKAWGGNGFWTGSGTTLVDMKAYGFVKYTVSSTQISANFIDSFGQAADSFAIVKGASPSPSSSLFFYPLPWILGGGVAAILMIAFGIARVVRRKPTHGEIKTDPPAVNGP